MTTTSASFRALIGIHTCSPLHAGVLGGDHIIDRPIHRDVHTRIPKLSSNALKGALREQNVTRHTDMLFGVKDDSNGSGKAGLLNLTDARLLLFPVRSAAGGWAWVSCPSVLRKFREEAALTGNMASTPEEDAFYSALQNAINDRAIYAGNLLKIDNHVLLYNHAFEIDERLTIDEIDKWQDATPMLKNLERLAERLVIVSDDNFRELTLRYTEISTRNKINDQTGVTGGGALFTEEHLPTNSLLYALAFSMPDKTQDSIEGLLDTGIINIQIAGNATLGKGLSKINWHFPKTTKIEVK